MRSGLYVMKKRGSSGGWQHNLAGISPLPAKAALPNACDAFNARTMAIKACLPSMRVVARKLLHLLPSAVMVARLFPIREKCRGAPAVWLGAKRTYPMYPMLRRRYLAGFLCQGAAPGRRRGNMERVRCSACPAGPVAVSSWRQ